MKSGPLTALSALIRWRNLGEVIASNHYRKQSEEMAKADIALKAAQVTAQNLRVQRSKVLGDRFLDLTKIGMVAQMEQEALQHVDQANDDLATAMVTLDQAREGYVSSRANSRVAEERHGRVLAEHRRQDEIGLSDRMAELVVAHSRRPG